MAKKQQSNVQLVKGWLAVLSLRTKLAIGGVVIFIALVILLIVLSVSTNPQNSPNISVPKPKVNSATAAAQREVAIRDSAQKAIQSGKVSQAEQIYQSEIASEQNVEQKLNLYIDNSEVLYDAGQYAQAIAVAKQGEAVSDDKFLIADWLSRIYEDQKQFALAAQYYTLAGQWAKSPMNKTALSKSYYDENAARVTALEGK